MAMSNPGGPVVLGDLGTVHAGIYTRTKKSFQRKEE